MEFVLFFLVWAAITAQNNQISKLKKRIDLLERNSKEDSSP